MATLREVDFDPFASSPAGKALPFDRNAALAETDKALNLPAGFSAAQIQVESGGNPKARSSAGAMGLAQVMPATLAVISKRLGRELDPDNEKDAVDIHREVMRENLAKFKDPAKALMAYNGGWDPDKWDNPETAAYVGKVKGAMKSGQNPIMATAEKVANAVIPSAQAEQAPKEATLHEVDFDPFAATSPAPAAPKRSVVDSLGHQFGLALRGGVAGTASIPAMMSDAVTGSINAGLDKVAGEGNGFRFQSAGKSLDNLMTAAGVAVPENAQERVVQDMVSSVAGAGSLAKGGLALAKYASGPAARGVGKMLAAGPKTQLITAATGAGASGTTREAGGGAGAQMAAGLIGAGAPIGLAYTRRQPNGNKQLAASALKANKEGYVIPPADLNPGMTTEVLSGVGGKIKTAQVASQRNQSVTNDLARKALGIKPTDDLTTEALALIRKDAGQAYQAVAGTGIISPSANYATALDDAVKPFLSQAKSFPNRKMPALVENIQALKTGQFDAADAVETIKVIRSEADAAYRAGDNLGGKAFKQAAAALEDAIDEHLVKIGASPDLLKGYREARKTIAKTYTVEKALNSTTGNVNAQKLASDLAKGKALSGELKTIAEIGQAFPKATQALKEAPKSVSILDVVTGLGAGISTSNPAMIAAPIMGRPIARSVLLSKPVQRAAIKSAGVSNTGVMPGIPAAAVGAAIRSGDVTPPPETYLHEVDFDPFAQPAPSADPTQQPEPPARIDPNSMAQPEPTTNPAQQPAQEPMGQDVQPGAWSGPAADPAPVFATQARADGTLAVTGDRQALREMLTAAGVPVRSMVPINGGMLIGRSQAAMVQEAIERMNAVATDPDAGEASPDDQEATPSDGADLGIAEGGPSVADSRQEAPDSAVSVTENPVLDIQNADIVAENAPLEGQAPIDIAAHGAATSPQNDLPEPTPGQQQAGNYKLGHDRIAGMDISIENPQGSVRRGVDPDGKPWETQMQHHYGYFRRTSANDGDKLDVFVKPGTPRDYSGPVYVIDQVDPRTGKLDEHKTILGAKDEAEAKEIYRSNYAADWRGMGSITRLPLPVFKAWAASGDKKHPLGDLQGEQAQEPPIQVAALADQAEQDVFAQAQEPALEAQPPQSAPVDRIQALRDAGENKVADMLQRKQVTNVAQTELASMQAATPELQHHASPAFSQHYQQRRLAGMKPAEASAHAGMLAAVQTAAPQIGMPDSAVKALASRLQDVPIEDAPGFIERFTQALIKRGIVQPFEGSNQIASMAEQARDLAMNGALDGLYGDNPATTYS